VNVYVVLVNDYGMYVPKLVTTSADRARECMKANQRYGAEIHEAVVVGPTVDEAMSCCSDGCRHRCPECRVGLGTHLQCDPQCVHRREGKSD